MICDYKECYYHDKKNAMKFYQDLKFIPCENCNTKAYHTEECKKVFYPNENRILKKQERPGNLP